MGLIFSCPCNKKNSEDTFKIKHIQPKTSIVSFNFDTSEGQTRAIHEMIEIPESEVTQIDDKKQIGGIIKKKRR